MGIINFETFLFASLLLAFTPGSDTMFILGRSISQGKKAGILSAIGISSGALIHCLFAVLGLSIILAQSALAFQVVKYAGAAYLIYLGLKALFSKQTDAFELNPNLNQLSGKKIYFSGILTNLLNPKVALFFLAFLPQFVEPTFAGNPIPFMILGLTVVITGTLWCLTLAIFSSKLSSRLRENRRFNKWLNRITGGLFISLGIKLAFVER